jgi:hypothetical protein
VTVDPTTGIPSYALTCAEMAASGLPVMLCQIEVDFEAETTTLEVLG